VGSRLGFDSHGRFVAIETDGTVWLVLGNVILSAVPGEPAVFGWLGKTGRPPTPRERAEASDGSGRLRRQRRQVEVPDEALTDEEAVRLARLEQQREPVNLISRAA
jgi:hypothetical protein